MSIGLDYSGIVLTNNPGPTAAAHLRPITGGTGSGVYPLPTLYPSPSLLPSGAGLLYQTFLLPTDHTRAASTSPSIPSLTGFQLFVSASTTGASLSWEFDRFTSGEWIALASGVTRGVSTVGSVWLTSYFARPVPVTTTTITSLYRIVLLGSTGLNGVWYSTSNQAGGQAYVGDGIPLLFNGLACSLSFRVLALTADSGTDFLGNIYRSVVRSAAASNV